MEKLKYVKVDLKNLDIAYQIQSSEWRFYLQVMDIIEKYTAEDDENYYSGNYICSKRLKENIDYIPWNNKNLHLRDYYSKCKGSK